MNRIRKINNTYQVLLTPSYATELNMELMVGNWSDPHLKGFYVKEFSTLQEAQHEALKYGNIEWDKLVRIHIDFFHIIKKKIKKILDEYKFIYELDAHLTSPNELKDTMFDRVIQFGNRFSLTYDLNDIMMIRIVNPWTKNLEEMCKILKKHKDLNLFSEKVVDKKIFHLIGKTTLGTTYEIKLWPTTIHHWAQWQKINKIKNTDNMKSFYDKTLKLQHLIDNDIHIR
jgi:hypothetical protein